MRACGPVSVSTSIRGTHNAPQEERSDSANPLRLESQGTGPAGPVTLKGAQTPDSLESSASPAGLVSHSPAFTMRSAAFRALSGPRVRIGCPQAAPRGDTDVPLCGLLCETVKQRPNFRDRKGEAASGDTDHSEQQTGRPLPPHGTQHPPSLQCVRQAPRC